MHNLAQLILDRIKEGLERQAVKRCSSWAMKYRVMGKPFPGPWTFDNHPWTRDMHDSEAPLNVGLKAAQCGYTEMLLNRSFFKIDIEKVDVLYVLPAMTPDAGDFSAGRFNAALDLSPHLAKLFSDVKNVGHKRAGAVNFYLRGAKSSSGLKSIPVAFLAMDEVNEFSKESVLLARERLGGQVNPQTWAISTPTIAKVGISLLYEETTQEHFFFKCPSCSRLTELIFPECIEIAGTSHIDPDVNRSRYICKECKNTLPNESKKDWLKTGRWVPSFPDRDGRGFYVNQLYSPADAGKPSEMAKAYHKTANSPADRQEFHNSKLGNAWAEPGSQLTPAILLSCTKNHVIGPKRDNKWATMGVDIGTWLHYEIVEWTLDSSSLIDINTGSMGKVIGIGKVKDFSELDDLMRQYRINHCVVDANPERRAAFDFANRFWGHVNMCFYGRGVQGKQIQKPKENRGEPTITVDRTSWLDLSLGRFRTNSIQLPCDVPEEYRSHLCALVRRYERDENDNPVGKYVKGQEDDHYAHARNYSEIALNLMMGLGKVQDIK